MMDNISPKISCICISANRSSFLRKAIRCFENQSYANKELVISIPNFDKESNDLIDGILTQIKGYDLIKLNRKECMSLGQARNSAIKISRGDYICIWDDDDWYHPDRLKVQMNTILLNKSQYKACVLNHILIYDKASKIAYLSFNYSWEGTLLCQKDLMKFYPYKDLNKGEDSIVIDNLERDKHLLHILDVPHLYIYIVHQDNTSGTAHLKIFLRRSVKLNEVASETINDLVQ